MTPVTIPNPSRVRALLIIDVQPGFIKPEHSHMIPNIVSLITQGDYDLFVLAEFSTRKGSLWDTQSDWTFDYAPTPSEITGILPPDKTIAVKKSTKSIFMMKPYLAADMRAQGVKEVHVVGYDINDCVLATANDAFDLGFSTYVIEEAADSSEAASLRDAALDILRNNEMTNHSSLIKDIKIV